VVVNGDGVWGANTSKGEGTHSAQWRRGTGELMEQICARHGQRATTGPGLG